MTDNSTDATGVDRGHRLLRRRKFIAATIPGDLHERSSEYAAAVARAVKTPGGPPDDDGPTAA